MFITLTSSHVTFCYGSKLWKHQFEDIAYLSILKKKKTYFFENASFVLVTALAYYAMIFSNLSELYYIAPALFFYSIIICLRFHDSSDSNYYVVVKDVFKNEIKIKIKASDRILIGKQIDDYLHFEFNRIVKKSA